MEPILPFHFQNMRYQADAEIFALHVLESTLTQQMSQRELIVHPMVSIFVLRGPKVAQRRLVGVEVENCLFFAALSLCSAISRPKVGRYPYQPHRF